MPRLFAFVAAGALAVQVLGVAAHAQTEDRYGPGPAAPSTAGAAPAALLSWPGKADAATPPAPDVAAPTPDAPGPPPQAQPISIYGPTPTTAEPPKLRGVILADPGPVGPPWTPPAEVAAPPPLPSPAPQPPAPQPIAALSPPPAPAQAAPAPQPQSPAPSPDGVAHSAQPVRIYSVARQYGVTPDPDPLPAQFFGEDADMAAPPPPLPPKAVAGNQAATAPANTASNRAREVAIDTADVGDDGPTGGAGGD